MERIPNVWITYLDPTKNVDSGRKFGNLRTLFTGYIDYDKAVEQCRQKFEGEYQEGDYILVVGDPKLIAIVINVAEKYFSENGKVNLLSWNKDKKQYYHEVFVFPDHVDEVAEVSATA